jgi:hypothetical protein
MGRYKSSAQQLVIDTRREQVVNLRKSGATLSSIAKIIADKFDAPKYDATSAHRDVMESLKKLNETCRLTTEEYRQLELERLDSYLFRLQVGLRMGNPQAVNAAIKVGERRAKLLGIDAPVQIQVEEIVHGELTSMVDQLQALMPPDAYSIMLAGLKVIGERSAMAGSN